MSIEGGPPRVGGPKPDTAGPLPPSNGVAGPHSAREVSTTPGTYAAPSPDFAEITQPIFRPPQPSIITIENHADMLQARALEEFQRRNFNQTASSAAEAVDTLARAARMTRDPSILARLQNKSIISAELAAVALAATGAITTSLQRFSVHVYGIFQSQPDRQIRAWHRLARTAMAYRVVELANGAYHWALGIAHQNRAFASLDAILIDQAARFFAIGYDSEALAVLTNLAGFRQRANAGDAAAANRLSLLVREISSILPATPLPGIPMPVDVNRLRTITQEIYSMGFHQFAADALARLARFEAYSSLSDVSQTIRQALTIYNIIWAAAHAVGDAPTVVETQSAQAQLRALAWQRPHHPETLPVATDIGPPPPKIPVTPAPTGKNARAMISALLEQAKRHIASDKLNDALRLYQQARELALEQGADVERVVLIPATEAFGSFIRANADKRPEQASHARALVIQLRTGTRPVPDPSRVQTSTQPVKPSPPVPHLKPPTPVKAPPNPGVRELITPEPAGQVLFSNHMYAQAMYRFTVEAEAQLQQKDFSGAISSMVGSVRAAIHFDVNATPITHSVNRAVLGFIRFLETYFSNNPEFQQYAIKALRSMLGSHDIQFLLNPIAKTYNLKPELEALDRFEAKASGPTAIGTIIVPDPDEEAAAAQACAAGILPGCEALLAGTGVEVESGATTSPAGKPSPVIPPARTPR